LNKLLNAEITYFESSNAKKNKIFWAFALNTTSETYSSPLGPTTGGVGRGAAVLDPLITD